MNVLNKIKSKRNKESSELSQAPPVEVKVESIFTQQKPPVTVLHVVTKSMNVVQRQSIMKPVSQRSKSDTNVDLDQATVTEYFLKKDRQNKKARKNLSESGQIIKEEQLISSVTINVKKGYSLGSISIFQGEAITKQEGREDKRRKMTFSCGSQTIQFPQGISKIFLTKITFISEDQAIFIGEDIIKVSQKGYTKK